jgi:hydroxymethylbilane synthase
MELTAGTRGSDLAIIQVKIVEAQLKKIFPDARVEIKITNSSGDKHRDRPIEAINERGVFTKAIDEMVLNGEARFAVHSMKDLPMALHKDLVLAAVPERASPYDSLVATKYKGIDELPSGAVVGTASPRRKAQLLHKRGDLEIKLIRGNVDTRLGKLRDGEYDAIILAEAGLDRLGIDPSYICERLNLEDFTPTACQGALAVMTHRDDKEAYDVLSRITDRNAWETTMVERGFMAAVGGGCKTPIGVIAKTGERLELYASILAPDGQTKIQYRKTGEKIAPEAFGGQAGLEILDQGGAKFIVRWR